MQTKLYFREKRYIYAVLWGSENVMVVTNSRCFVSVQPQSSSDLATISGAPIITCCLRLVRNILFGLIVVSLLWVGEGPSGQAIGDGTR